jgi:hypothetical protein
MARVTVGRVAHADQVDEVSAARTFAVVRAAAVAVTVVPVMVHPAPPPLKVTVN